MINAWINTYDDCNPCKTIATREIQVVEPWSYMPTYIKKYIYCAHNAGFRTYLTNFGIYFVNIVIPKKANYY